MSKVTIYGDPDAWVLGVRAARRAETLPVGGSVCLQYGSPAEWEAFARRNAAGISVWISLTQQVVGDKSQEDKPHD